MSRVIKTIEILDGSQTSWFDRLKVGLLVSVALLTDASGLTGGVVTNPGSGYTSLPSVTAPNDGSGATLAAVMLPGTVSVAAAGTGYVADELITLTGGTFLQPAVIKVENTKLVSVAINAGGSGYQVGDKITLAGGSTSHPAVLEVATLSGSAVATVTIFDAGVYESNSATFTQGATTGVGTGATFQTGVFGVNAISVNSSGTYSVLGTNPKSQGSSSGSGTGATINIDTWVVGGITVSVAGTGFKNGTVLAFSGGGGAGAAANGTTGTADEVSTFRFKSLVGLPATYTVFVQPNGPAFCSVTEKQTDGFTVSVKPDASAALAVSSVDILVVG